MATRQSYRNSAYGYGYVDGNVVRKQNTARPIPERERRRRQEAEENQRRKKVTSTRTKRNRARALQMNLGYVGFLTVAAIATLFVCVNYLQLQAQSTTYRNQVSSLESQLSDLKLENDTAYENALSSVNLQDIRSTAITKLGMMYAEDDQVKTYDSNSRDYVRQYQDVPNSQD